MTGDGIVTWEYRYGMRSWLLPQWLADQEFIVVSIDNRGTPGRGRDWERALYKKFGSLPLADQVAGLQALRRKYPRPDRERGEPQSVGQRLVRLRRGEPAGQKPGRASDRERIVATPSGMAICDVALAHLADAKAVEHQIGQRFRVA